MEHAEADWENLPTLCLSLVLDKLHDPSNLVRFGAVCKHWHFVFQDFHDMRLSLNPIPMLLTPTRMSNRFRQLSSLQLKSKFYNIELPESHVKRICGSSYGWLAAFDKSRVITLLNPFKDGITIHLPEIKASYICPEIRYDLNEYYIHKVILSADPLSDPNSYVVVVIYCFARRLAFYKSGQSNWIYLDENLRNFSDVIFYKNLAYAIGTRSLTVAFDVDDNFDDDSLKSPTKVKIIMAKRLGLKDYVQHAYLFESSKGDLFAIKKYIDLEEYDRLAHFTKSFKIFKLILDDQNSELLEEKEVKNIDGDVVFVGDNQSMAVSALDFPEAQPNSIYFTDDYHIYVRYKRYGPRDNGFFNIRDGKVGKYDDFKVYDDFKLGHKLPPYIWIRPPIGFTCH